MSARSDLRPLLKDDPCLYFLRQLHRAEVRELASALLSRQLDAIALAEVLVAERLGVYAYAQLEALKLQPLFPRAALSALRAQWQAQQERNVALHEALTAVTSAFRSAGIDYILLKGLYFGQRFYAGCERRFTWDLDVLVHKADSGAALRILGTLGFERPRYTFGLERFTPHVSHALECQRLDGLAVDLHWTLRRLPGVRLEDAALWSTRRFYALGASEQPVPADEHTLLLLLLGIAADIDRSVCRFRALWDVYVLLHALPELDWAGFLRRREPEGLTTLVVNVLALILHRLDGHAEFPALAQALAAHRERIQIQDKRSAAQILARTLHNPQNHLLFARWQPLPAWQYWPWWAATFPMRLFFARRL